MSYHGYGLGQTSTSDLVTMSPGPGSQLQTLQQMLGVTADGMISSGSSPTLTAARNFGTQRGLPVAGLARAPNGGLIISARLRDAIMHGDMEFTVADLAEPSRPSSTVATTGGGTSSGSGKPGGASTYAPSGGGSKPGGAATTGPLIPSMPVTSSSRTALLVGGGILAAIGIGGIAYAMTR